MRDAQQSICPDGFARGTFLTRRCLVFTEPRSSGCTLLPLVGRRPSMCPDTSGSAADDRMGLEGVDHPHGADRKIVSGHTVGVRALDSRVDDFMQSPAAAAMFVLADRRARGAIVRRQ